MSPTSSSSSPAVSFESPPGTPIATVFSLSFLPMLAYRAFPTPLLTLQEKPDKMAEK